MSNGTISQYQWAKFFKLISEAHSVRNACLQAKISRSSVRNYRLNDTSIAERWAQAEQEALEFLEDTARKRAVEGVVKETGVYYKGELVQKYIETKYSDRLLLAMMGARDARYRTGNDEIVLQRVKLELTTIFNKLQRGLSADEYAKVLDLLASEDMIDVTPTDSTRTPAQLETSGDTGADL